MDAAATTGSDGDGSGVVGEGEREGQGRRASVCEVGERGGVRPTSTARQGERRGGGQLRGTHDVLAVEQLLACAGECKQLAGTGGGLGQ